MIGFSETIIFPNVQGESGSDALSYANELGCKFSFSIGYIFV
jgi:hypothetical protein